MVSPAGRNHTHTRMHMHKCTQLSTSPTQFLDDCSIADHESQFVKRSDCDTIFIVCNFQPDKKSAEAQVGLLGGGSVSYRRVCF